MLRKYESEEKRKEKEIRNKAIDEFVERMKEKWIEPDDLSISSEFFDFVEEIADEMKAGGENEID